MHNYCRFTRMYMKTHLLEEHPNMMYHVPVLGSNVGLVNVVAIYMLFSTSILGDTLLLAPLLTETLQLKPKLAHMHHCGSPAYIDEK